MVKKSLYPLKFGPIPGERVWGGDYLKKKLFQDSENSLPIGESLDLCGLEGESTAVVNGFLVGNTIDEVIETYLGDVVGDDKYDRFGNLLPIIVKRLDVKDYLSIQVHPDNLTAMERYESYGKNEMWYIMDADPDAVLYLGLKRDSSASEVYEKCKDGTISGLLNKVKPKRGEYYLIKSGCIHSCHGVRLVEISQASDITYRLYDWEKEKEKSGIPFARRETHLDESIDIIDYNKYDVDSNRFFPKNAAEGKNGFGRQEIIECTPDSGLLVFDTQDYMVRQLDFDGPVRVFTDKFDSFIVYICLSGSADILYGGEKIRLSDGETALVPAAADDFLISPCGNACRLMECYLPKMEEIDDYINPGASPFNEDDKESYDFDA